jgi:phospholipid/cholesterol/gamma-HCH transport system substrate-binding protein
MNLDKEFKIGLLTTISLLILYLGFNFLKGKELLAKTNTYYAVYKDAQGLTTSSRVLLNGCPVGIVKSIDIVPDKNYQVEVALSVQKQIQLTDQTSAKLVSNNILGNKIIELVIKEGKPLQNKEELKGEIEQDFQAIFMESTLPTLQDAKAISELANRFMHNLVDNTERINNIFSNLETAARQMRQAITINQKDLGTISKNLADITQTLSDQEIGVKPLFTKLNQLATDVGQMKLPDIAVRLEHILAMLETGGLNDNLNQVLASLDNLLADIRQYPSRYVHFSVFGKRHKVRPDYARKKIATAQEIQTNNIK